MGKKGPMPNFETIDDYIANQPEEAQKKLQELRSIIKDDGWLCKIYWFLSISNYYVKVCKQTKRV